MTSIAIKSVPVPGDPLPEMPLDPSQVTQGNPVARGAFLYQSADKKVSSGFWSCTQGEFDWQFAWDEFIQVLEGEVTISEENGSSYTLTSGSTAHFPRELKTHWHVSQPMKKFFVIRMPEPLEL